MPDAADPETMPSEPTEHAEGSIADVLEHPTTMLVRAAKLDRDRFGDLYRRIAPAVFAWSSLRMAGPLRKVLDPEDVVQEVWFRTLEKFETYDPARASFRTWVFGIANHVILQGYRRLRQRMVPIGDGASTTGAAGPKVPEVVDDGTSVSRVFSKDERLRACLETLLSLKDDEKKILIHCGLEGLSASEAADLLGATPDAVAKRWQRLRSRLREASTFRDLLAP